MLSHWIDWKNALVVVKQETLSNEHPTNRAGSVLQSCPDAAQLEADFPNYVHPVIRDVVELASNKTKIITETGEYVFVFEERRTFVLEAAEFVTTGILEVHYNSALVFRLTVSPPDSDRLGKSWVARGIDEFKDGEWVAELTHLNAQLAEYETEQTKKTRRDDRTSSKVLLN